MIDSGDRQRILLRERILRKYALVTESISIGEFCFEFNRVADPEDLSRHMEVVEGTGPEPIPKWQPYWAANWDASWAVAHVLLDLPLAGRTILDLGCGLGLTGALGAARGATVWMVDAAQPSLLFARLNTWPWRDRVHVRRLDWQADRLHGHDFSLIIGSDIIYDSQDWPYLEQFWREHLAAGGKLLLGESGRRTGALFPAWLTERGWKVERSEVTVDQCEKPLRIFRATPDDTRK